MFMIKKFQKKKESTGNPEFGKKNLGLLVWKLSAISTIVLLLQSTENLSMIYSLNK